MARASARAGDYACDRIVTCAGLHSDRVAALTGRPREVRIVPFRGEYYKIRPERQYLVRNLIYPVPDPKFPFLGVHFTRLIHGGVEAGPNAVLALAREGYTKSQREPARLGDALTFPGLWRFLRKISEDVLAGNAAILQPRAVLRVAAETGPGNSTRGSERGRRGRPRAGDVCAMDRWSRIFISSKAPANCTW